MTHTEKCDTNHPSGAVIVVVNHNRSNNKSALTYSGDKAPLAAQIADHVPPSTHDVTLESSCVLVQSGFQLQDIVDYKPAISAQQGHSRLLQQSRNGSVTSECWVSVWRCILKYCICNEGERYSISEKGSYWLENWLPLSPQSAYCVGPKIVVPCSGRGIVLQSEMYMLLSFVMCVRRRPCPGDSIR